ncbi:MAG: hypothetical protein KAR44_10680, partial [Candidatus Aegiribacteria sp.]|nr:hypothetical protein [Candidatus Aegiribacteria sp.]
VKQPGDHFAACLWTACFAKKHLTKFLLELVNRANYKAYLEVLLQACLSEIYSVLRSLVSGNL